MYLIMYFVKDLFQANRDKPRRAHPVARRLNHQRSNDRRGAGSAAVESDSRPSGNLEGYVRSRARGLGVTKGDLT